MKDINLKFKKLCKLNVELIQENYICVYHSKIAKQKVEEQILNAIEGRNFASLQRNNS